jgi:hypothetical protein
MPMSDERIDRAIDAVAREMTAVDARGDLRARVMTRIQAGGARGVRRGVMWPALAAVAATVAIAFVARHESPAIAPKPDTTSPAAAPLAARRLEPPAQLVPSSRGIGAVGGLAAVPAKAIAAAARRIVIPPSALDALAPPPIDLAPIAVGDLDSGPSMDLQPLDTIAPITAAPLGEGDRR